MNLRATVRKESIAMMMMINFSAGPPVLLRCACGYEMFGELKRPERVAK